MMWKVPFLDLRVTDEAERADILAAVATVLDHGRLINGPEVEAFERAIEARCNVNHAIGVGSGTDALIVALRALNIGKRDEVIVPALSFIATANAVRAVGAEPAFVDIGPDLCLDPCRIKGAITYRTKAIMPVHWAGRVAQMSSIRAIARANNLWVIEDASQAFGAHWLYRSVGTLSDVGCFSFNPMKVLAATGEAGMVVTNNPDLADRARRIRYHGLRDKTEAVELGANHRLDTIQAAILLSRLKRFPDVLRRRHAIAQRYDDRLRDVGGLELPRHGEQDVFYTYTVQSNSREYLKNFLARAGIETQVQHPCLMPEHRLYRGRTPDLPPSPWLKAKRATKRVLCLPCNEKMTDDQVDTVVTAVRSCLA